MLSRKHSTALSLIASAMTSASLLGTIPSGSITAGAGAQIMPAVLQEAAATAQAAGWSAPTEPAARPIMTPTAATVNVAALKSKYFGLTDAEGQKLDLYYQKFKRDVAFDPAVTQFLELSKPGETISMHQFSANDDNDTVHTHYFNRSTTSADVVLFVYKDSTKPILYGFMTDAKFDYVLGYVTTGGPLQKMTKTDGEARFATEMKWWAKSMDDAPNP